MIPSFTSSYQDLTRRLTGLKRALAMNTLRLEHDSTSIIPPIAQCFLNNTFISWLLFLAGELCCDSCIDLPIFFMRGAGRGRGRIRLCKRRFRCAWGREGKKHTVSPRCFLSADRSKLDGFKTLLKRLRSIMQRPPRLSTGLKPDQMAMDQKTGLRSCIK